MRALIGHIEPSLWMEISSIVFCVVFLSLVVVVYWPQRRAEMEKHSKIPLED